MKHTDDWVWDIRGGVEGWWPKEPEPEVTEFGPTTAECRALVERDELARYGRVISYPPKLPGEPSC